MKRETKRKNEKGSAVLPDFKREVPLKWRGEILKDSKGIQKISERKR
jgi:hypothetical protein